MTPLWLPPNYHEVYQLTDAVSIWPQCCMRSQRGTKITGSFTCMNYDASELFMERTPYITMFRDEEFPYIINYEYWQPANGTIEAIMSQQESSCVTFHMYDQEWESREMYYGLFQNNIFDFVLTRMNDYDWLICFDHETDFKLADKLSNCVFVKDIMQVNRYVTPNLSRTGFIISNSPTTPMQRVYTNVGLVDCQTILVQPINSIIRPERQGAE